MKTLVLASMLLTSSVFAQSADINTVKSLLLGNQETLERIYPGQSKRVTTLSTFGECKSTLNVVQTVLRIEGEKMIVLSEETTDFSPECGAESFKERVIFYEKTPTVAGFISELESDAQNISLLSVNGPLVKLTLTEVETDEEGTQTSFSSQVNYDFNLPLYHALVRLDSEGMQSTSEVAQVVDLNSVDLSDIVFCENNDEDSSDCVRGNFADILF